MNIKPPKFPTELAFQHGFEVYGEAYLGTDWVCPAFNFAVALSQASMALGRKYVIHEHGKNYPNFYQVILGRSHLSAKSPTLNRALEGIDYLRRNVDPSEMINVISSVNSPEGLKEHFATHEKGDPDDPMAWYSEGNGVRGFVPLDEFGTLLSKSRNNATEGISVELTRLYNPTSTPVENNTRQNKSYGEDWVVNVFGCSTLAWYEKFITQGDFSSGFLNRFVFYLHEQQPLKSRFDPPNQAPLGLWNNMLVGVMRESIDIRSPKVYNFSDEAFEAFDAWFVKIYEYLIEDPEDIKREASARIVSQTLKLALVYSIFADSTDNNEVSVSAFESAKAVGEYWGKCAGMTLDQIDFDRQSKAERMMMDAVKKCVNKDGECTKRSLRRAINYKSMSSGELNKTLESLVHANLLDLDLIGKKHIISIVESD